MLFITDSKREIVNRDLLEKFVNFVIKIRKGKPDIADLVEVKNMLEEDPELWHIGHGFAGEIFDRLVMYVEPRPLEQMILKAEATDIKKNLDYNKSNQLEKLIIDEIILCWTYQNHAHEVLKNVTFDEKYFSKTEHEYWQNNLTQCQKRYLKALETLARVRKLNVNIQLNIAANGGKQINVNSGT